MALHPKHGASLDLAESELGVVASQCFHLALRSHRLGVADGLLQECLA
jgi:hypothetical protein